MSKHAPPYPNAATDPFNQVPGMNRPPMTAETDLLPCPGCNGTNTRVIGGPGTRGGPKYWAGCDQCRWRTWGNTEAEAIAAWNRRAKDAEIEALRAEAAEAAKVLRGALDASTDGEPLRVLAIRASNALYWRNELAERAEARADSLRAEVERLTFEMGCLQQQYDERTACVIVHRGAGLACSDAVRSAYSDERRRADKLEEALRAERRRWVDRKTDAIQEQVGGLTRGDPEAIARCDAAIQRIDALLREQEELRANGRG